MSKKCIPPVLGLFLFLVTTACDVGATQVDVLSLDRLGREAELVVRGEVQSVRSYWNEDGTRILTEVSVDVAETFKGRGPGELRVIQMGGVVDGVRMTVHGALSWRTGEEVVLFLERSLPGLHRVSGLSQGKFAVSRDGDEVRVQRPSLGGVEWIGAGPGSSPSLRELRMGLPELLERSLSIRGGE